MRLIVFDPFLSTQASTAEEWVPIKAGTDAAAALSMANLLLNEYGLYDRDYIKWKTNGPYLVAPDGLYRRDQTSGVPLVYNTTEKRVEPFNSKRVKDCALEGEFEVDGVKCAPSFQLLKEPPQKILTRARLGNLRSICEHAAENRQGVSERRPRSAATYPSRARRSPTGPSQSIYLPRSFSGALQPGLGLHVLVLLNHLVGSADVPGGALAFGPPVHLGYPGTGRLKYSVEPDKDGLLVAKNWPYAHLPYPPWSPRTLPRGWTFRTCSNHSHLRRPLMGWDNNEELWQKFKIPYRPDVMISFATNQIMSVGNPNTLLKNFLKKFNFIASFKPSTRPSSRESARTSCCPMRAISRGTPARRRSQLWESPVMRRVSENGYGPSRQPAISRCTSGGQ